MNKLVLLSALISLVLFFASTVNAQVVTCTYCSQPYGNGTTAKCHVNQKCCNNHLKTAACTDNSQECLPAIQCNQVSCGVDCSGSTVWCPSGQVCCNACQGRNLCVAPGGSCDQSCYGC